MTTIKVTKFDGNIKVYSGYNDNSIWVMVDGIILGDKEASELYKKLTAPKFRYDWMRFYIGNLIKDCGGNIFQIDNITGNMAYLISAAPLSTYTITGGKYRVVDCKELVDSFAWDSERWEWHNEDSGNYDFSIPVDSRENRI